MRQVYIFFLTYFNLFNFKFQQRSYRLDTKSTILLVGDSFGTTVDWRITTKHVFHNEDNKNSNSTKKEIKKVIYFRIIQQP